MRSAVFALAATAALAAHADPLPEPVIKERALAAIMAAFVADAVSCRFLTLRCCATPARCIVVVCSGCDAPALDIRHQSWVLPSPCLIGRPRHLDLFAEIAQMVGKNPPEFYNPPSCPFYSYQPTWSSPYGQQTVSHVTVGANGSFPPAALEANYYARWGPGSIAAKEGWYKDGAQRLRYFDARVVNASAAAALPSCPQRRPRSS